MSEPTLALQGAIYAALVSQTEAGVNIFDRIRPDVFPRIQIGSGQAIPNDVDCVDGFDVFLQVDVYSKGEGYPEAKAIAGAVHGLLHKKPLTVTGYRLVDVWLAGAVFSREQDETISRARIQIEAQLEAV